MTRRERLQREQDIAERRRLADAVIALAVRLDNLTVQQARSAAALEAANVVKTAP